MIRMVLSGDRQLVAVLRAWPAKAEDALIRRMNAVMFRLHRHIVRDKLSGQVLKNRTGNLRRSVFVELAHKAGPLITAGVAVARSAPYARAQEYGAFIPERFPRRARALHWTTAGGQDVFAMRAAAFQLPARSFMRTALAEFAGEIERELNLALKEA